MAHTQHLPLVVRPPAPAPTGPSDAVVARLHRLPLHTLDDLQRRFAGVPIELADHSPHFPSLRLLTTSTCRMRCQYPGEDGLLWCHNEGLERNGIPAADLPTMLRVVAHLRARYGIREVVLAGLQPRLDDQLLWFIGALHQVGIDKVSMTSHGLKLLDWLPRLHQAGLDALVLSVQGFSQATYQQVMGLDAFDNALQVVTPDVQVQPCLWRPDLRFPLLPLVERGPDDPANAALDTHLRGTVTVAAQ